MVEPSLETLRQEFRKQECLDDRMFVQWSNALIEWKVKGVPLPADLEVHLRYKLARYGMGMTFDRVDRREDDRSDWKTTVDRIVQLIEGIQLVTIEDMEEHLDEVFLIRLRLILIALYDLRDVQQMQEIPVQEMEFCLALFLLIFHNESKYGMYKLRLIPVDVVMFLRAVASAMQAQKVDGHLVNLVKQEEINQQFRKLKECFRNVEQLYNMQKIWSDLDAISDGYCAPEVASLVIHRLKCASFSIQVFNKLCEKIVKVHRYAEEHQTNEENYHRRVFIKLSTIKIFVGIELFVRIRKEYQHFLVSVRNCTSLGQVKQLLRYIESTQQISQFHRMLYQQVFEFYSNLVGKSRAVNHNIADKFELVRNFKDLCISLDRINIRNIVKLVENNVDVKKVQHLIQQEIERDPDESVTVSINELWQTIDQETNFTKSFNCNIETRVLLLSNISNGKLLNELTEKTKLILENINCSTIGDFLENCQRIPQSATMNLRVLLTRYYQELQNLGRIENDTDLLKCGHQMFYGRTFLSFLTTGHPRYELFITDPNMHVALEALIITEKRSGEVNESPLTGSSEFKRIFHCGLQWTELQEKFERSILNMESNTIHGAYPSSDKIIKSLEKIDCTELKETITMQLYSQLNSLSTNYSMTPILAEVEKLTDCKEFKLKAALEAERYDDAFALSEKQILLLNEDFFSWEALISQLDQTNSDLKLWQLETFWKVAKKLVDVANVGSLSYLLTSLDKLLPKQSDLSEIFRVLRALRRRIADSLIQDEKAAQLDETILTFIFEKCRNSLENVLPTTIGNDYVKLFKSLSTLSALSVEHGDIWKAPTLLYNIIDCQKVSEEQKILMLKMCLALGNRFWIQPPPPSMPIMAYALSKGCNEVLKYLVEWICIEVKDPKEKFAMIIEQCSVDVFKLFLSKNAYSDEDTTMYISNALQEMYIKQVYVSRELQIFLWFKLSEHGFTNLCSNSADQNNPREWIHSIRFIIEDVRKLKHRSDRGDFLGVDNEVLFHLRMVHNHLFYVKDKPHFKNLPLKEMVSLLAIFLSSFASREAVECSPEDFTVYRMVLNKLTLMKFLEFIAEQLDEFLHFFSNSVNRLSALIGENNSCRKREKLQSQWKELSKKEEALPPLSDNIWNSLFSKKYSALLNENVAGAVETVLSTQPVIFVPKKRKQFCNRITRLYHRVKQLYSLRKIFQILQRMTCTDDGEEIAVASLKRFNQIFGESIKNTKNSQNLPSKLNRILNYQLRDYILIVKKTRDVTCHDFPLAKKFFPLKEQHMFYARMKEMQVRLLTVTVATLLICTYSEYWRCLFGSLRQCSNLRSLKSLVRFVGNQNIVECYQAQLLDLICKYHDETQGSLNAVLVDSLSPPKLSAIERLKKYHKRRLEAIEKLREEIEEAFDFKYRDIQIAAFTTTSVEAVWRLLSSNLLPKNDYKLLEFIESNWIVLDEDLKTLTDDLKLFEQSLSMLQSTLFNLEINRESMQEYHRRQEIRKIVDHFFDDAYDQFWDKQKLEDELNSRFDKKNYFNNIFLIDDKISAIRYVFEKISTSEFKHKMITFRNNDIAELENIFRSIQQSVMDVYVQYGCSEIESLINNISQIPQEAILAIEYWLMELCEILTSTGQFQDNFHTVKCDLQMICGRNFRNYLAHDGLSYDILTCSSRAKVLINGFVMARKSWNLFEKPKPSSVNGFKDSRIVGPEWLCEQKQISYSIQRPRGNNISNLISEHVLTSGCFWMTKGIFEGLKPLVVIDMVKSDSGTDLWSLVDPLYSFSRRMFSAALQKGDFLQTANYLNEHSWDQQISSNDFPCFGGLLKHLYEQGNYEAMLSLLKRFKLEKIGAYVFADSPDFLRLILNHFPASLLDVQIHSILQRKPMEHLLKLIPDGSVNCSLLKSTILANHLEYFEHLLKLLGTSVLFQKSDIETVIKLCARLGRSEMMNSFSVLPIVSQDMVDLALSVATKHHHWNLAVSLLRADRKANPWNYMNEFYAGDLAIRIGNLKLTKKFLATLPKTDYNIQSLLSTATEFGTVPMVELLIAMGCDIWQNEKLLLLANANKKDVNMLDFVEKLLFKFTTVDDVDSKLNEWKRVVHERLLLDNFRESSRLFLHDYQRSKKMLKEILKFGKMDDGCSVKTMQSCCIPCKDPRIEMFQSIGNVCSLDVNSRCLSPTGPPTTLKVLVEQEKTSSEFIRDIVIDVFNAESALPNNLTLPKAYSSQEFICYGLSKLIDKTTLSTAITGRIQMETQEIRFIRVGRCSYIAKIDNVGTPTYLNGFFNCTNRRGQTIFSSLHSDVDVDLIELLLATGVDLTTVDKDGKNALILTLDALCSWDVLKFMLEHCVKNNIHCPQGVHIFDMQDLKGCTLLQYAILIRRFNVVAFLLEHGVEQTVHDESGMFPIHYAILSGSLLIVETLIDHKKEIVNLPQTVSKHTPLMMAVNMNNTQLVNLLLQKGADMNIKNGEGETAIAWAISMERLNILNELLKHATSVGIDILDNITADQQNALQHTMLQDNVDIFKTVLRHALQCSIDEEMDQASLAEMKTILLSKDSDEMNIFDNAYLFGHATTYSYLMDCENFYRQKFGEPLRRCVFSWQSAVLKRVMENTITWHTAIKALILAAANLFAFR